MKQPCGGCDGLGSHRRHCTQNPDYTREREWADQAEHLADRIGANHCDVANVLYRAAGMLNRAHDERIAARHLTIGPAVSMTTHQDCQERMRDGCM